MSTKTSTKPVVKIPKAVKAFAASMSRSKERAFIKDMTTLAYRDLFFSRTRGKKGEKATAEKAQ